MGIAILVGVVAGLILSACAIHWDDDDESNYSDEEEMNITEEKKND